ncbi:MAG: hypothetical protein KGM16_12450 [Bacteroidota bacterium]|nr:hypothetical protein [Bacteroidota bacterium]
MIAGTEVSWWKELTKKDMLEMAFVLSKKALPAWNNFHLYSELKHELKTLPENALQDIEAMLKGKSDEQKLNEHFTSFVTPVINIQDGYLKFPYEVKLAFLSVFHILHGMLSTSNMVVAKEAFSSSISRSIDAIKIAGILTADEISLMIQKYYLLSKAL